jgi:hypothetical protein
MKEKITKPKRRIKLEPLDDDLRPHYDIDYSKARPNRFAKLPKEQTIVLLDKEVSKIFRTPEQVNHALHALIDAMPAKKK